MKKIVIKSVLSLALMSLLISCKDTVDLQGPYEEKMYVFGLLDASQSSQKIKIYKVFSGANGIQSAQNLDSIYYKSNELNVKLVEDSAGRKLDIPLLYANNSTLNSSGPFNPNDAVYYYTEKRSLSIERINWW
jgi:hypothetical protein